MAVPVHLGERRPAAASDARGVRVLYLEVANTCNSRCTTCPLTFGHCETPAMLGRAEAAAVAAQAPDLERVVLHGLGEPLLNPELGAIVGDFSARGVQTCFNTNGLLLNRRRTTALLDAGLTELRVSLDAADADTYRRVRGVRGHAVVVGNLARLVAMRRARGLAAPVVTVYFTAMHDNVDELPGVVTLASDAGADALVVQRLTYWGEGMATVDQSLFGHVAARERAAIAEAEARAASVGLEIRGTAGLAPLESLENGPDRSGCMRPWTTAYVTAHGNVYACCIAPFTGVAHDELVMGNVFESSLGSVWSGPRYGALRRGLRGGTPLPFCEGCGERWSY